MGARHHSRDGEHEILGFKGAMGWDGDGWIYKSLKDKGIFSFTFSSFTKQYLGNLVHTTNRMRMTKEEGVDDSLFLFSR